MVAGGQPHGLSPAENVLKECQEEAGVPLDLAKRALPTGVVSPPHWPAYTRPASTSFSLLSLLSTRVNRRHCEQDASLAASWHTVGAT